MNRSAVRAGAMLTVAAWLTTLGTTTALAAGGNDNRGAAVPIASIPTTIGANNGGATREPGDVWNNTVWYQFTPTVSGNVAVRASGPFDNTLEVWAGGVMVVENDDFYDLDAMLVYPATAGTSYLIGLGSYWSGATGTATVYVSDQPPATPDAPSAVADNGGATVSWTAPQDNGMAITRYTVRAYDGSALARTVTVAGSPPAVSTVVTGLSNGTDYTVTVTADNLIGSSAESAPSPAVRPLGAPGAPAHVQVTPGNQQATVAWAVPATDGGSAISGYELSTDGGGTWDAAAAVVDADGTSTVTLRGLINGTSYPVSVRASNSVGVGAASAPETVVPAAVTPPVVDEPPVVTVEPAPAPTVEPAPAPTVEPAPAPTVHAAPAPVPAPVHKPKPTPTPAPSPEVTLIPVPASPPRSGPVKHTVATQRSYKGIKAVPIPALPHGSALHVGQAVVLSDHALFRFDSAVLTARGRAEVRALAAHLRGTRGVRCEGYTDYAGNARHEQRLSQRRALVVCKALRAYGAKVSYATIGYGGKRPVVVGGTARGRAENRRVVVVVTS